MRRDPLNCNACGHACGPRQACLGGVCYDSCSGPFTVASRVETSGGECRPAGSSGRGCPNENPQPGFVMGMAYDPVKDSFVIAIGQFQEIMYMDRVGHVSGYLEPNWQKSSIDGELQRTLSRLPVDLGRR